MEKPTRLRRPVKGEKLPELRSLFAQAEALIHEISSQGAEHRLDWLVHNEDLNARVLEITSRLTDMGYINFSAHRSKAFPDLYCGQGKQGTPRNVDAVSVLAHACKEMRRAINIAEKPGTHRNPRKSYNWPVGVNPRCELYVAPPDVAA